MIIYILTIIQCLIFNELIILNFFGLNIHSNKEIIKRDEIDTLNLLSVEVNNIE